jgi:DMSO/TMAO reductase YedYZ molybdopterin-dependent catalytic subunit
MSALTRRQLLSAALAAPAALVWQPPNARLLGFVPLGSPGGRTPPFGRLLGAALDARLFTDLSLLGISAAGPESPVRNQQSANRDSPSSTSLVTPTERFFVRTAVPSTLPRTDPWTIRIGGLVRTPVDLNLREWESRFGPSGRYLIECSGNADQTNYGLMSVADWEGVPLQAVLDHIQPSAASYRVLVSGVDDESRPSRTSVAGASWIFSTDDLQRALLAVRMNGAPLPRDHGFPVRLVVPGWYGCTCIKWVDRIELVPDAAAATTQMREFAARTHQPFDALRSLGAGGSAVLARDFAPAVIDTAAMPVRVEKWVMNGRVAYKVIGIIWGGSTPTNSLSIRFRSGGSWARVDDCPLPTSTLTWSLWSHTWRPDSTGRYQIVLRVDDPTIRTRRLDLFFYVREIEIDEV